MIQIKNKPKDPPEILYGQGPLKDTCKLAGETNELIQLHAREPERFDGTGKPFEVKSGVYGHPLIKEALIKAQNGKCCFCEAKVAHVASGDIEHFRPKKGYAQSATTEMVKPGYYWLTYEWSNLLFACEICNRRHKKNLFPLLAVSSRAVSHSDDLSKEDPVFIHPVDEDPMKFLTFHKEVAAPVIGQEERGKPTIDSLGLNDDRPYGKLESRRDYLKKLRNIYKISQLDKIRYPELAKLIEEAQINLQNAFAEEAQYSSMARANYDRSKRD